MSNTESASLSVKVMINKEKNKVMFVEAGRDFTDVLLSFLMLPLGKISKLLEDHYGDEAPRIGSLSSLYKSLADLDESHFANKAAKRMLLDPMTSFAASCFNLKLDISDSQITSYTCAYCSYCCCVTYALYETEVCSCPPRRERCKFDPESKDDCAFLAKNEESFFISDDLRIMSCSTGFLQILECLGVVDLNGAELMNVTFGIDEVIGLLKRSLISDTPFTDLIVNKTKKPSTLPKQRETRSLSNPIEKKEALSSKHFSLKVMMQKSTHKLLFAQADDEFVDLLFSFFTIPLGLVESLLDNNTCLKNIDNLYNSLVEGIFDKYLKTTDTKTRLLNPNLPLGYTSKDQILPLSEEGLPTRFTYYQVKSPKGAGNYIKKPKTFIVSDDLKVTNFNVTSGISILSRHNVPLYDVYEVEVKIGQEEALKILKASLTSTSALSHGLTIDREFKKQPKQEK